MQPRTHIGINFHLCIAAIVALKTLIDGASSAVVGQLTYADGKAFEESILILT